MAKTKVDTDLLDSFYSQSHTAADVAANGATKGTAKLIAAGYLVQDGTTIRITPAGVALLDTDTDDPGDDNDMTTRYLWWDNSTPQVQDAFDTLENALIDLDESHANNPFTPGTWTIRDLQTGKDWDMVEFLDARGK